MEEVMVEALLSCDREARILAARGIRNLTSKQRHQLAESGVLQPLVLMLCSQDYEAIEAALLALLSLAFGSESQIIQFIVFSGAVVTLLRLICGSDKSSKLTEKAVALLEKIVSSSQDALRKTASMDGAIQGLVEIVEDSSRQSQEHAVGILLFICQSCRDRYRGLILTEGAMPGLLQLSGDGSRRAKEMANALLLLLRDCSSPGLRKKQLNNDFLEEVMRHIDRGGKDGTGLRLVEEMIAKLRT
ncbi:hypothetical protein RJ639_035709 [Escallonia herrerae]|uniref:U-box domain-containing protein n=1 Tax=Escallonia herrerae TaxID=1293975 RepID=A0AA88WXP2_9ASTE|nr:hypothetical protein RJ639_035709 [Escallonia herrerae]